MENNIEKKIIEVLSKHPEGITIMDISKKTNIHRNTVSKYVFGLVKSDVVSQRRIGPVSLCSLKTTKEKIAVGKKSLAKISLLLVALSILSIFTVKYAVPILADITQPAGISQANEEMAAGKIFNVTQKEDYSLIIETEKEGYLVGSAISISGWFGFGNSSVGNQSIELFVMSDKALISQITFTDLNGNFSFELADLTEGNYTAIIYTNYSNGTIDSSVSFYVFQVSEAPEPLFNISLAKSQFVVNESLSLVIEGKNNTEFLLTIFGPERIENLRFTTDDEGRYVYNTSFAVPGNYTAEIGETKVSFEVIPLETKPEIELKLVLKEFYYSGENISLLVEGTVNQSFNLTVTKNGAVFLSVLGQTDSSGCSEIWFKPSETGNYEVKLNYEDEETTASFEVREIEVTEEFVVRTDKERYETGESITILVHGPENRWVSLSIVNPFGTSVESVSGFTDEKGKYQYTSKGFDAGGIYGIELTSGSERAFADFEVIAENVTENATSSTTTSSTTTTIPNVTTTTLNVSEVPETLEVVQGEAEVGKPVKWVKRIKAVNEKVAERLIPPGAMNALSRVLETGVLKTYEVEYETSAPYKEERLVEPDAGRYKKRVIVKSDFPEHYTNVKVFTDIPEEIIEKGYKVRVYHIKDGSRVDVTENEEYKVSFVDSDGNSFADRVEWVVPRLSEQEFEVSIIILNPYTYLRDNENWTVAFNTTGTADLIINSTNARWTEFLTDNSETFDEMRFVDIKCGSNSLKNVLKLKDKLGNVYSYSDLTEEDSIEVTDLIIENYSCSETGYITNNMLKAGYAVLQFTFGGQVAYAYDTTINACWNLNTAYEVYTLSTNVSSSATCFNVSANHVTLDCNGYWINYSQSATGYAVNNSAGYDNITIKNCNIVQGNSTLTTSSAIYGEGMANSKIQNNSITASTPIDLEVGSNNNNIIMFNNLTGTNGITIYIYYSSANNITYNDIKNNSTVPAIRLSSCSNTKITYNNITTYGGGSGIYLYGSMTSQIISNNITTYGGGSGIYLYHSYSSNNNITYNNIKTLGQYGYGIHFQLATNNRVINSTINATESYDIYLTGIENETNYIINSTFNKSDIYPSSPTTTMKLFNQYYLDVYVQNSSGSPIESATVVGNDSNSVANVENPTSNFTAQTLSSGYIPQQIVTEFMVNGSYNATSGYLYFNNYTINASKTGYSPDSEVINITKNTVVYLTLTDATPPKWRNQTTNDTDNRIGQGGSIELAAQGYDNNALDWAWLWTNETGGNGKNYTSTWWNSSWAKRKQIQINNSAAQNLTDYQVLINVTYDSDMQSDFRDLRFTYTNATQPEAEISYWIENNVSSSYAEVWIKVPFISNKTNATVYMYYGNPSVSSTSNGTATMLIYDDFSGTSLNSIWTTGGVGTISVTSGYAYPSDYGSGAEWYGPTMVANLSSASLSYKVKVRFYSEHPGNDLAKLRVYLLGNDDATMQWFEEVDTHAFSDTEDAINLFNSTVKLYQCGSGQYPDCFNDGWHTWIMNKTSAHINDTLDGTQKADNSTSEGYISKVKFEFLKYTTYTPLTLRVDEIQIRNYIVTEPTYSIGSEESYSPNYDYIYAKDMQDATDWTWSNFTWQNSSVTGETVIAWRIYYSDTSGNENVTDEMTFDVSDIVSPLWRNQGTNDTDNTIPQGGGIQLHAQGFDETGLDWAWLGTNETTVWENKTQNYSSPMDMAQPYVWLSSDQESGTKQFISKVTYYVNTSETEQSTTTSSKEALRLTWEDPSSSVWLVMASWESRDSSTSYDAQYQVAKDGTEQALYQERVLQASNEYISYFFPQVHEGDGGTVTYSINFNQVTSGTAYIRRARLVAIRLDNLQNTNYNYSFNDAETTGLDTTWGGTEDVSVTISPSTEGWYLILASMAKNSDSTSYSVLARVNIDSGAEYIPSATGSYGTIEDTATTEFHPFQVIAVRKLTTGSHTISLQAISESSTYADIRDRSLVVVRLSDVFPFFNVSDTAETSTTSTTFQNKSTLTIPSGNPGDYLILSMFTLKGGTAGYDYESRTFSDDNSEIGKFQRFRPQDVSDYITSGMVYNVTFNENQHVIKNQFRREDASGTAYAKNSEIVAIKLAQSEVNKTWENYTDIDGSDYYQVTEVKAIVTVDSYDPRASSNNEPDIEVGFYNGSEYKTGYYCNLNNTMGNDALNTTDYNCTVSTTDSSVLDAWKTASNRKIQIRGIFMDSNATYADEINVTAVYANVSYTEKVGNQWLWSNFTWSNSSLTGCNVVGWRIYYNDTSGNENVTDTMTFESGDCHAPLWRNQGTNDTDNTIPQGGGIQLYAQGYDGIGLDWAWLETNETGQPKNKTGKVINTFNDSSSAKILTYYGNESNKQVWVNATASERIALANMNLTGFTLGVTNLIHESNYTTSIGIGNSPAIDDVDNDGTLEIVISNSEYLYVFNHTGTALQLESSAALAFPTWVYASPAIYDIDNDGYKEIIFCEYKNMTIWNHTNQVLKKEAYYELPDGCSDSPAIADLDNDGTKEIVSSTSPTSGTGYLYVLNYTGGVIRNESRYTASASGFAASAIADLDNDGYLEIVTSFTSSTDVYVFNHTSNTLRLESNYNTGSGVYASAGIADVDNDGTLEIVVASDDNYIYVFHHTSNTLTLENRLLQSSCSSGPPIIIADLDNDGTKEIIWACYGTNKKIYVLNHTGTTINKEAEYTAGGQFSWAGPAIADTDGDGTLEIGIVNDDGKVYILNHTGTALQMESNFTAGFYGYGHPAFADVDKDGYLEMVVGAYNDYKVYVFGTQGKYPEWRKFKLDLNNTGYQSENGTKVYPANVSVDTGNDGVKDWTYTGEINGTNVQTADLNKTRLNEILSAGCSCAGCSLSGGDCTIPINVTSNSTGILQLSNLNILQTIYFSPMDMNDATDWTWSNFTWSNSSIPSGKIAWRIYYNDTSGNENVTDDMTFTIGGTSNQAPSLEDTTGSIPTKSWGESFTFKANVSDPNGDTVNVSLWKSTDNGITWSYLDSQNCTSCSTEQQLTFSSSYFSCSDLTSSGGSMEYKFNATDYQGGTAETSAGIFTIEKDDAESSHSYGEGQSVNRTGTVGTKLLLQVRIKDTDKNEYVGSGRNCSVYVNSTTYQKFNNQTDSSGYCSYYFDPDCNYPVGNRSWLGGANSSDVCYKAANSSAFNATVIGQLFNNLEKPIQGYTALNSEQVNITGNVSSDCSSEGLISGATVNFSLSLSGSSWEECLPVSSSNGWYNCTWNSSMKTGGMWDIRFNSTKTNYNSNSTVYTDRFELTSVVGILISDELARGLFFTNLTGSMNNQQYAVNPMAWNNVTWNYNNSDTNKRTEYWIQNNGTNPQDFCSKGNNHLTCNDPWCGSTVIVIGNVSWSNSSSNNINYPQYDTTNRLTLDYATGNKTGYGITPESKIYLRYWLYVPSIPGGKYNTTVVFEAVSAGEVC